MIAKFQHSWELFKASITITLKHRKLLWFPFLTTILTGFIAIFFISAMALPAVLHDTGYHLNQKQHWVALKNYYFPAPPVQTKPQDPAAEASEALTTLLTGRVRATDNSGRTVTQQGFPWGSLCLFPLYFASMCLATFFNVAFYSEIIAALNGRGVSFRRGLETARSRLPSILAWSLLAGLVGWLIRAIEQRVPFAARIVTGFIGMAWSIAAVFAIPVIIQEQPMRNPLKILQQSASTLKRTWGEGLIGYVGFSAGSVILFAASLLPLLLAGACALLFKSIWLMVIAGVIWVLGLLGMAYVSAVAGNVYRCALYMYASEGVVPEPYNQELLDRAWKVKKAPSKSEKIEYMSNSQRLKNAYWMAACLCAMTSSLFAAPFSDLSFEAASKEAAQKGKIVMVDFYTTWCGPCKLLDKTTWTDPAVIQLLEQKTVALRIDAEKEVALAKHYKIEAYPSVLLIKPDGAEIDRLVGYKEPKAFMADFNAALGGKDSVSRAKDSLLAAGANDPGARMQYGITLAQKGMDAEALTEFLWCYDHGLEASPAFLGVRASFLLMHIKNLAAHYPPALKALEIRRDERQAKVAAGSTDFQTLEDLTSLNKALGQEEKNLAVYDQLPANSKVRGLISHLLTDQFLAAKRYADVLQGSDGKSDFKREVDRVNLTLDGMDKTNPLRKQMEENFRNFTVMTGAHYFEALAGLKRNQEAEDLAADILKFNSSPTTRKLLSEAAQHAQNAELTKYVQR